MSVSWVRVEEIFLSALEREPEARAAHLAAACRGDARLRDEVESLLASHERAGSFIEAPAAAFAPGLLSGGPGGGEPSFAGRHVGRYRIERELGRGGMGAVFLARRADDEYEKHVAVKLIRGGPGDRLLLHRFLGERQILADLDHPNVARLIDGGATEDGTPYLVMDYIEGVPVDEYCDRERLPTSARLRLFRDICAAVDYAHRNLVVHRDLKPSNILVTPDGTPKLLDFGIAKLLGPGGARAGAETATAARLMTPEYASPEQVRGASITTASDVYSLGVLLYKLLTGQQPYSFKTLLPAEIEKVICETDPEKPSAVVTRPRGPASGDGATTSPVTPETAGRARGEQPAELRRRLRGELDAIVLTAMRKEPERRYASAAQFSEDIGRHLEGRPVLAHRDSFGYRAAKFVRRNRAAVTAAALVVVALVAGLALALWQAGVARRERDRAERRFNDVRRLSNALLTDIAPKIENLQGATEARQSVVTQSLTYLDSLAGETGGDLPLQSELATAYEKVGDIQGNPENPNLGDLAGAIASYEKARRMRQRLLESNPNDFEQRRLLAANHQSLGYLHWQANELEESARQTATALGLYEKLAAERPDSPGLRLALAQITYDAGDARKDSSTYSEAIVYFQKALDLLAPLLQNDTHNVQYLKLAGNCYAKLGNSLSWAGRQKEGEAEAQKAVRVYESLAADHPNDVSVSNGLWQAYWMATSTYEDKDDALSHEYAVKALKTIQSVVGRDPADSQARYRLARTLSSVGQTSTKMGKAAEGLSYLEKAVSELTRLLADEPRSGGTKGSLGAALMRLAEARAKQKDFAGAVAELERAERIYVELRQADATDSASLRSRALTWDFRAEIHLEWAKAAAGEQRRAHEEAARNSYAKTLEILERLDAQKLLPEVDREWLEKLRADSSGRKR